jgi:hypothetical protein
MMIVEWAIANRRWWWVIASIDLEREELVSVSMGDG